MNWVDNAATELLRYTEPKAAQLIGRSSATLRRWRLSGLFTPGDKMVRNNLTIYLYTPEDIDKLRKIAAQQRTGPKKKENSGEKGTED